VVSPYHQQANAVVERLHKYLVEAIVKVSCIKPYQWPEYVSDALFAQRVTTGKRGFSRYELVVRQ
jgi:hypothetical protein